MAIRKIIIDGDAMLRKISRPVTDFNERLWTLIDDMWDTMYKADGVGLAAPQVAVLRRVAVVDTGDGVKYELINPVILGAEGEQVGSEGCLSIPEFNCNVKRPYKVTVRAFDRYGKAFEVTAEDFPAVAFCHEIDHLNGILFKDKECGEPSTAERKKEVNK